MSIFNQSMITAFCSTSLLSILSKYSTTKNCELTHANSQIYWIKTGQRMDFNKTWSFFYRCIRRHFFPLLLGKPLGTLLFRIEYFYAGLLFRITNAGDACCFVEPSINHISLMEKCEQFRSGLILCDAKTAKIISTYCNLVVECDLFNEPCFLLQVRDENFDSANKITATTNIDLLTSSNVFFYASTSGSCGQTKSIGVTFKCFMPNIETLTWVSFRLRQIWRKIILFTENVSN